MFDYQKFEDDVLRAMENTLRKWVTENTDVYILSLDYASEMDSIGIYANTKQYLSEQADAGSDDYWYYKYYEEE